MKILRSLRFLDGVSNPKVSETVENFCSDSCSLQVYGDFTSAVVEVEGVLDVDANVWNKMSIINLNTFDISDHIGSVGFYTVVGVEGVKKIRVNAKTVEGGKITVYGELQNTGA